MYEGGEKWSGESKQGKIYFRVVYDLEDVGAVAFFGKFFPEVRAGGVEEGSVDAGVAGSQDGGRGDKYAAADDPSLPLNRFGFSKSVFFGAGDRFTCLFCLHNPDARGDTSRADSDTAQEAHELSPGIWA